MKYFLLGANDGFDINERKVSAFSIVEVWLSKPAWPVYAKTKNRLAFEPGAHVVIYVGGKQRNSQSFFGTATIDQVRDPTFREIEDAAETSAPPPVRILVFKDVRRFPSSNSIRPLISRLEMFGKLGPKWGVALVGGSRRLSKADYDIIVQHAQSPA